MQNGGLALIKRCAVRCDVGCGCSWVVGVRGSWAFAADAADAADAGQTWGSMSSEAKQQVMTYAHSKDAIVMVAAGGATEDIGGFVRGSGPTGTAYGLAAATWASVSNLDLFNAPYVLYGVKYIDLVSSATFSGQGQLPGRG